MMQQLSPTHGGVDPGRRPAKRQRLCAAPHYKATPAALALLERIAVIRTYSVELRDEHQELIDDFDRRTEAKRAALNAAAKVAPAPPTAAELQVFSRGDVIAKTVPMRSPAAHVEGIWQGDAIHGGAMRLTRRKEFSRQKKVTMPAMSLLVEPDPPEKVMVEQSVIWRAHTINRRNAELARERLPKQPEAQRGKTHWDYLLDEAVWLSNDYREERKWKVSMAKKISKMILQYHAQKVLRVERAKRDEQVRIIRLANVVARDVRKFWNQIQEVADYRQAVIRDAQLAEEREDQLKYLLKQTEAYTHVLASNLNTTCGNEVVAAEEKLAHRVDGGPMSNVSGPLSTQLSRNRASSQTREGASCGEGSSIENNRKRSRVHFETENDEQRDRYITPVREGRFDSDTPNEDVEDDEATLDTAEAEEDDDPEEIDNLRKDCEMSVEEILQQQGINPALYRQDKAQYAVSSGSESGSGEEQTSGDEDDENEEVGVTETAQAGSELTQVDDPTGPEQANAASTEGVNSGKGSGAEPLVVNATVSPATAIRAPVESRDQPQRSLDVAVAEYIRTGEPGDERNARVGDVPFTGHGAASAQYGDTALVKNDASGVEGAMEVSLGPKAHMPPSRLLRGSLRDYQHAGMEWLVTLYEQRLNGILADEMGLGKTIQTIALLAWLAVERGVWGPHLVVVPTSVMINWEVEFKKWLPGFKVMTYYGSMKERRAKRQGWSKRNTFHVCITSYNLVVQDASALRRKRWVYLILDEAHNIKNFQSQRWQTLLNFPSKRRLLLTGTPLQNSVMELWSLMHFLMPDVFRSHAEFKDWFSKPLNTIVAGDGGGVGGERNGVVANLHRVLRPFLLRRLKVDVEKSLPGKVEHIVPCPLSKRQRQLYEDFMARSDIKETLNSGDFIGVMNVLMQLRKVCNHPDLFEGRPIVSPFTVKPLFYPVPSAIVHVVDKVEAEKVDLSLLGLDLATEESEGWPGSYFASRCAQLSASDNIQAALERVRDDDYMTQVSSSWPVPPIVSDVAREASRRAAIAKRATLRRNTLLSDLRTRRRGMLGADLVAAATMTPTTLTGAIRALRAGQWDACTNAAASCVWNLEKVAALGTSVSEKFVSVVRSAVAPSVEMRYVGDDQRHLNDIVSARELAISSSPLRLLFRSYEVRSTVMLPDARLIQWDCGKLQVLEQLMRKFKAGGHRVLIFTQMTRVLDLLESFLNLHAHRYLRLDGATKTDERQKLVERFNTDVRVFCMILTTRAGGLGLNLTGADTVVFYDTDYNPSMDAQAQDRAHRIGQTRPVHIYRLVSTQTVEENILRKAQQKRNLESLVISQAGFTTDAFRDKLDIAALVSPSEGPSLVAGSAPSATLSGVPLSTAQTEVPFSNRYDGKALTIDGDDVGAALLAREDEREGLDVRERLREEELTLAEFNEDTPGSMNDVAASSMNEGPGEDGDALVGLTPIQRYALNWIEADAANAGKNCGMGDALADHVSCEVAPTWKNDFSVGEMLRRHEKDEMSSNDSVADEDENRYGDNGSADELVYEQDTTDTGRMAYLKALTDTDADIKLYLPLRDGDPEELKKSAVVNGTAAAGLECAEDAAFFPHAYNRMSRTPYATRRQKEKAAANLSRRMQEEKKIKEREKQEAIEAAMKKNVAVMPAATSVPVATGVEKGKVINKSKSVGGSQRGAGSAVGTKRPRLDSQTARRIGGAGGAHGSSVGSDGVQSGLFTRPAKKSKMKGNSAFNGKIVAASKEEIGLNDRWTTGEEQRLIEMVNMHNKNMLLVADALRLSPHAVAGHRISRGHKRCIDRMKTLTKDIKNGPPVSKASKADLESMQAHVKALTAATQIVGASPPTWAKTLSPSDTPHDSHLKASNDVATRVGKRFSTGPPTIEAVAGLVSAPEYHVPGAKTTECTPSAVARRRRPFLRPRAISERRPMSTSGQNQRQPTSAGGVGAGAGLPPGGNVHPVQNPARGHQSSAPRMSQGSRGDRLRTAASGSTSHGVAPSVGINPGPHPVKRQSNVVYKMPAAGASMSAHAGLRVPRAPASLPGVSMSRGVPISSTAPSAPTVARALTSSGVSGVSATVGVQSGGIASSAMAGQPRRGHGPSAGHVVDVVSKIGTSHRPPVPASGTMMNHNGMAPGVLLPSGPPKPALPRNASRDSGGATLTSVPRNVASGAHTVAAAGQAGSAASGIRGLAPPLTAVAATGSGPQAAPNRAQVVNSVACIPPGGQSSAVMPLPRAPASSSALCANPSPSAVHAQATAAVPAALCVPHASGQAPLGAPVPGSKGTPHAHLSAVAGPSLVLSVQDPAPVLSSFTPNSLPPPGIGAALQGAQGEMAPHLSPARASLRGPVQNPSEARASTSLPRRTPVDGRSARLFVENPSFAAPQQTPVAGSGVGSIPASAASVAQRGNAEGTSQRPAAVPASLSGVPAGGPVVDTGAVLSSTSSTGQGTLRQSGAQYVAVPGAAPVTGSAVGPGASQREAPPSDQPGATRLSSTPTVEDNAKRANLRDTVNGGA